MAKLQFATLSNLQEFLNLHNVQIDTKISEAVKSSIKTVSQSEDGYTLYFYTKTAPVTIDEAAFTITIPQPTGKADKVKGAISGHLAGLDANGNLVDSGKAATDFDAAGAANTAKTEVMSYVGTIPTGAKAKDVVSYIKEAVKTGTYDDSALKSSVAANTAAISTLNGTGAGSVKKAVAAFVEGKGYKTTDQKVKNTLNTTAKAYVTGTTSAATGIGEQVFDTGVYLDTTAGKLVATTFAGALQGNATTATSAAACTGNAASATKLAASRNFSLTGGAVADAVAFNGGGNVALSVKSLNTDYLTNGANTLILNCGTSV